jgi:hypothetical protein
MGPFDILLAFKHKTEQETGEKLENLKLNASLVLEDLADLSDLTDEQKQELMGTEKLSDQPVSVRVHQ